MEKYTEYSGMFEMRMLLLNKFIRWGWDDKSIVKPEEDIRMIWQAMSRKSKKRNKTGEGEADI